MKILIVEARGLHIGYLGCYGNEWIATENLDQLAAEGVVFDQHIAANANRQDVHRIWQSGRYFMPAPGDSESRDTQSPAVMYDVLRRHGVTVEVCASSMIHPNAAAADFLNQALVEIGKRLDKLSTMDRWLLHADLFSLLPPWNVPQDLIDSCNEPEEEAEDAETSELATSTFLSQQRRYAAAVTLFDQWLGQLFDELRRRGLDEDITLLVTTDCGQDLGERTSLSPSWSHLHEEIIHIPLIMRLPELAEAGRRVFALAQPVDFLPTLCDLFGIGPPHTHGHSLVPLLHGKAKRLRDYTCAGLLADGKVEWALRTLDWSFHLPVLPPAGEDGRQPLLYVKPDDRWEVNNLRQHHLEWTEKLERTLKTFVEATRRPGPFQPPRLPDFITKDESQESPQEGSQP